MILVKAISVKRAKSSVRNSRGEVLVYDDATEIQAGEEIKQFGDADKRGEILIRWNGRTYLARASDLSPK